MENQRKGMEQLNELEKQLESKENEVKLLTNKLLSLRDDSDSYHLRIELCGADEKIKTLRAKLESQPKEIINKIRTNLLNKAICVTGTSLNVVRLYEIEKILENILEEFSIEKGKEND